MDLMNLFVDGSALPENEGNCLKIWNIWLMAKIQAGSIVGNRD